MKDTFEILGLRVEPGQSAKTVLELTLAGVATKMPLFVFNGAYPGPTLVVTSGVHAAEYVAIHTTYRLARELDAAQLYGQVVIAPIVSMTSFAKRAIYLAPPDDKNLNRQFPGDPNGSYAQQLADWIFQNLIRRADAYIDLHGGDLNEALVPFSILRRTDSTDVYERSMALAQAFGLPNIIVSVVGGSTTSAAAEAGIPAVLAEVGGQGLWSAADCQEMYDGLQRAVAHLGVTRAPAPPATAPARVLNEFVWMRASHDGLWYPAVNIGDTVVQGQQIGHIDDFLGNTVEVATSPVTGVVMFLVSTLAMNNGDPLLGIGV
ncbi:MAG: succinylglutamate desuccinylase/aspartoacylase family protein [Anaerolineae bacterium]